MSRRPWVQSLHGRAIDLLSPRVEDVDFVEIAMTLALLNRYAGASAVPVSVALHTLIALDAAAEEVRPWVALHDCHEARIGEMLTPTRQALVRLVEEQAGSFVATLAAEAFETLEARHDAVIHAAAGLPLPDAAQRREIRRADLVALVTERRDFLAEPPASWGPEIEALAPLDHGYDVMVVAIPQQAGRMLLRRFHMLLPLFQPSAARSGASAPVPPFAATAP